MATHGAAPVRGAALDVTLAVVDGRVRLTAAGVDVSAPHQGVNDGLRNALYDVRRARARSAALTVKDPAVKDLTALEAEPGLVSLRRAGELLAKSFLPERAAGALAELIDQSVRGSLALRLAVDAPNLWAMPWEALPDPVTGLPLALHPQVSLYRRTDTSTPSRWAGPLRIVVAIASPDVGGGPLLDYEHELRSVLEAVRAARRSQARVEVVPFATTRAIREALNVEGGVHVLHISAHGKPGSLLLEDEAGAAREVTAERLTIEAIPHGMMPPVISLAACYTDVEGELEGASFAAQLAHRGACAVVGTQTSVTDRYATLLFSRLYEELAGNPWTDVVQALANARRAVQQALQEANDPMGQRLAGMDEWGVVTLLANAPQVSVIDPGLPPVPAPVVWAAFWGKVRARPVGQFVGRRQLQRRLPTILDGRDHAGLVLHGIGGIGKTTLAAEVLRRTTTADPAWRVASLYGPVGVDGLLAEVAAVARRELVVRGTVAGPQTVAVQAAAQVDMPWQDRFALLREHVLDDMAILVVLDNFEDNLLAVDQATDGGGWPLADAALAELLATWMADPGGSRLVITSRHPIAWPPPVLNRLHHQPVGPLSAAETGKLLWSLPHLDRHATAGGGVERVWRLVGGHPRALEYLDALLGQGMARFDDVTARLSQAVTTRLAADLAATWLTQERTLDAAVADAVTLIADDVLLTDHLTRLSRIPHAVEALAAISVYREPVPLLSLSFHLGHPTSPGLLAADAADREQAAEQATALLARYGLDPDDAANAQDEDGPLPAEARTTLQNLAEVVNQPPTSPMEPPRDLAGLVRALVGSGLVHHDPDTDTLFMHRWTATELHRHWAGTPDGPGRVDAAHRAAATHWRWRVDAWPQDGEADVHDCEEARHHLVAANRWDEANTFTELICSQLHQWGAWDRETSLIHDTMRWLPEDSSRRPAWIHQLGKIAHDRGDHSEAERCYRQALTSFERLDDQAGMAIGHHQLGWLAQNRGDYPEAERRCRHALSIYEQLSDQSGIAASYQLLGTLAHDAGDYPEAERRYRQALAIRERLGDQAGLAASYGVLGALAEDRGDYPEAEHRYRQALSVHERLGSQDEIANSHHNLGNLAQVRGDYAAAEDHYQFALDVKEQLGKRAGLATGYHQLGILAENRGDYPEAEHRYRLSLTIDELLGNQAGVAATHHNLGILAHRQGDYSRAEHHYQQSVTSFERLGNQAGLASNYHHLGILAHDRGDYPEAERRYVQSLAIEERLDNPAGIAGSYHQLGILAQHRGDYPEAERRYRQSLAINERLGNQTGIAQNNHQLGLLAQARSDYPEAERRYRQSLAIEERLGNQTGIASSYQALGLLAYLRGDFAQADDHYRQSLSIYERLGQPDEFASGCHNLGLLAQARGDNPEAERRYRQSLAIHEDLGNQAGIADSNLNLGLLEQDRGDYHEAERRYRQALAIYEHLRNQAGIADSNHNLGLLAHARGDHAEAERRYRQALALAERLGDQAGIATTLSQLGALRADTGQPAEAVAFNIRALAIRTTIGVPQAVVDLHRLGALRDALGMAAFAQSARQELDDESFADLIAVLDEPGFRGMSL